MPVGAVYDPCTLHAGKAMADDGTTGVALSEPNPGPAADASFDVSCAA